MLKEQPYEYHDSKLGVKIKYLISDRNKHEDSLCLITYNALYKRLKSPTMCESELRRASIGFDALVVFSSLCEEWRSLITFKFGKPSESIQQSYFARHYVSDRKAFDFYSAHRYGEDGTKKLTPELIEQYTYNASVMNTILEVKSNRKQYARAVGVVGQFDIWASISRDVNAFRDVPHDLPANKDALRRKVAKYQKEGYISVISGKLLMRNAAKVKDKKQSFLIEELISKHQNLNNVQIADIYNLVAESSNWRKIDADTIARIRKEVDVYTYAQRRGVTAFTHTHMMQNKRSRPSSAMLYWTHDGWDVELLFQKTEIDKKGNSITTYHNRPTVVMVLDPFNDYIVGYAIGERETPKLIVDAYKNAINHTAELFGERFSPIQIQSDNYQIKKLTPFYESLCRYFTPAAVKNSKSKVIEGFFNRFNHAHFQAKLLPNWSGHNVTAKVENQPNADYLAKIRHQFPTFDGVCAQIVNAIDNDRAAKREAYISSFATLDADNKMEMTRSKFLRVFGTITGYTNKLEGDGLEVTINGQKIWYDSFDLNFRKYMHVDWMVRFDPEDLSKVLVTNAKSRNGRLIEEIGNLEFILEEKYIQPMAFADQSAQDAKQRALVYQYNRSLKQNITERMVERKREVIELFESNPALETLQKILMPDSNGQHKDQKSALRIEKSQKVLQRMEAALKKEEQNDWQQQQSQYLQSKVNLEDYLND